jgi:hypothetical protein
MPLKGARLLLSQGLGEGVEEASMTSQDLTRSLDHIVIWNPLQKIARFDEISLKGARLWKRWRRRLWKRLPWPREI